MSLEYFDKNALFLVKNDYPAIPENAEAGIIFEQDACEKNLDVLIEKWVRVIKNNDIDLEKVWVASNIVEQEQFRTFRHKIPERVNEIVRKIKFQKSVLILPFQKGNFLK
jgi:D-lactate dehydrogenase (cytochrome)